MGIRAERKAVGRRKWREVLKRRNHRDVVSHLRGERPENEINEERC